MVMASEGYPGIDGEKVVTGREIKVPAQYSSNSKIFFAGVDRENSNLVTAGGRVLGVTAWNEGQTESRIEAYQILEQISFQGAQWRRDIGKKNKKIFISLLVVRDLMPSHFTNAREKFPNGIFGGLFVTKKRPQFSNILRLE